MRAVLVTALATAVAWHAGSALANQKSKCQYANGQYDHLATQACNSLCSSSSNSTNSGLFAKCCRDYRAGERLSGGLLVLPRAGGGGDGRGERGRGGRVKVVYDRRECGTFVACGSQRLSPSAPSAANSLSRPPPSSNSPSHPSAPNPPVRPPSLSNSPSHPPSLSKSPPHLPPPPALPPASQFAQTLINTFDHYFPTLNNVLRHFYVLGIEHANGPSVLTDAHTEEDRFFYYLGRAHASDSPIPSQVTATYFYSLGQHVSHTATYSMLHFPPYYIGGLYHQFSLIGHHSLPPVPHPAVAPGDPLHYMLQSMPGISNTIQYYFNLGLLYGVGSPVPAALVSKLSNYHEDGNMPTLQNGFFFNLGREHADGSPIPPEFTARYFYYLGQAQHSSRLAQYILQYLKELADVQGQKGGNRVRVGGHDA